MHPCDWCNSKEDIEYHDTVPDRWGCYHFCRNRDCATFYHNYIYANDISNGTPHYLNVPETIEPIQCAFCGICNTNVIQLPFDDSYIQHKTFCKNDRCFRLYVEFKRLKLEKYLSKIPFVHVNKALELLNDRLTVVHK